MANVERGVVHAPNSDHPGNRVNSCGPMQHGGVGTHAPNNAMASAPVGSCGPTGRTHPGLTPPNERHRFHVEDARLGWSEPVATPGVGAIPTNPFSGSAAGIVPAHILRDSAKR